MPAQAPQLWLSPLAAPSGVGLSPQEEQWCAALPAALQPRYQATREQLRVRLAALFDVPPATVPLHSPPSQLPRLEPGWGFVSISHSGEQLLLAWSPWAVGVDLERRDRVLQADLLAERFFPAQETEALLALSAEERRLAVLRSWVRKEAAIKWMGSSIAQDLRHWCWDDTRQELSHLQQGLKPPSLCLESAGWFCGLVGEGAAAVQWGEHH